MSKNIILPEGMSWFYNPISKEFSLIIKEDCKYKKVKIERENKKWKKK